MDLARKGFNDDKGDRVVLMGHSLGGQRAVSVAELLEKDGKGADQVVTMGTPMWHNGCQSTAVTDVVAKNDPVVLPTAQLPGVGLAQGKNSRGVWVDGGGHEGYWKDDRVFNQIAARALQDPDGSRTGSDSTSVAALDLNRAGAAANKAESKMAGWWHSLKKHL